MMLPGARCRLMGRVVASCGLSFFVWAPAAAALDAEFDASTGLQAYAVSSPFTATSLYRRRYLQTLGLRVSHLEGEKRRPGAPEVLVQLRMRMDLDFGVAEGSASQPGYTESVPGLARAPLDLMVGYIEGRNLLRGWIAFRLGRQYLTGPLGFWSFDGALVQLTTPYLLQGEVYAGLEQRAGLPLSLPRFEQGGVFRGDRTGLPVNVFPEFQAAFLAPAYGVALETVGLGWLHARAEARRVYNHGSSVVSDLPDPATGGYATIDKTRLSSERIGLSASLADTDLGALRTGFAYDGYNDFVSTLYGEADLYAQSWLTVGAGYDYFRPTFDGDSIFNFFARSPIQTVSGRAATEIGHLGVAASLGMRTFLADESSSTPGGGGLVPAGTSSSPTGTGPQNDWLGDISARSRAASRDLRLHAMIERGERSRREGLDVVHEERLGQRYGASARVSLYEWEDALRAQGSVTSFAYVIGAYFRPSDAAKAQVEWEHDMNRLVGQRYRVLALLEFRVTP